MKNMFRMPKGYQMMDIPELASAILKNPSNRQLIQQAFAENERRGVTYAEHESLENVLAVRLLERKDQKIRNNMNADNLSVVKSLQNSEYMKSQGKRGGENILGAYEKAYKSRWADARGYIFDRETGNTYTRKVIGTDPETGEKIYGRGKFVYNAGWDVMKRKYGIDEESLRYDKNNKQYRFTGKGNKTFFLNTTKSTNYDNESFTISQWAAGEAPEGRKAKPVMEDFSTVSEYEQQLQMENKRERAIIKVKRLVNQVRKGKVVGEAAIKQAKKAGRLIADYHLKASELK